MSTAIEETVKALVAFEADLDKAKADALDAKRRAIKEASDWADSARAATITKAQGLAAGRVAKAKEDAEAEAEKIRKKGESDLRAFESSISKRKAEAADLVASRLLGEVS